MSFAVVPIFRGPEYTIIYFVSVMDVLSVSNFIHYKQGGSEQKALSYLYI